MNESYNQFNAIPRRHREDGSRMEGIASGLMIGGGIATAGIGVGKITQKIANHGYNKRIKHIESGRQDRAIEAGREAAKDYGRKSRNYLNQYKYDQGMGAPGGGSRYDLQQANKNATEAATRGRAAVEKSNARTDKAVGKIASMRDSMRINKIMNSKVGNALTGSAGRRAITIGATAFLGAIVGGALDNPNG